jgi:integrase
MALVRMLLEGNKPATKNITLELHTFITCIVMYQAFSTTAWNLWTRCFKLIKLKRKDLTIDLSEVNMAFRKYLYNEPLSMKDLHACFKVFLLNHKKWQQKVDKGLKKADLLALLKHIHYNGKLEPDDFIFPAIGSNGIIHHGEHISHDAVQAWINEATTGAGIPRGGGDSFTTHTYHHSRAQWCWMFMPVGEWWILARVRWWGAWAENENISPESFNIS